VGVYLGPLRYPSRKLHVATLATAGYPMYDVWYPETRMLTHDFLTRSAQNRADYLRDQLGDPVPLPQDPDEFEDLLPNNFADVGNPQDSLRAESGSAPGENGDTSPATALIARVTAGTSSHLFPLISRDLDPRRAFAIRPSTDGSQRRTIEQCTPDEVNAARAAEYRNLVENGV